MTLTIGDTEYDPLLKPLHGTSEERRRTFLHRLGLAAIFALVWISVTQSETAQALQASTHFEKPFFITCFDHAITVLLLPAMYVYHRVRDQNSDVRADNWGFVAVLERHSLHPLRKLLKMAVVLNSVYIIADYMWFSALGMVSVAAGTSISNTAPFFVYLFSMCFLHEQASLKKLCGVLTSFIGVALITIYQDGEVETTQNTSIVPCMLVVVQTMIVGGYAVAYRVFVGEEIVDASTILTLTGICGAVTIPVWLIGSLLFAVCPWESMREPLGLPGTEWGLFLLVAAASLAGAYTVLQSLALCWTTPLITSVGAMMTIPLSLVWDLTINGRVFPWECILGSGLVMAGFGMLELSASKQQTKIELGK